MREKFAVALPFVLLGAIWAAQLYFGNHGYGLEPWLGTWFTAK